MENISTKFKDVNWLTVIHPHTWIHSSVKIGCGTVVFAGSVLQPDTIIGQHSIINKYTSADYDRIIGVFGYIAGSLQKGDDLLELDQSSFRN